MASNVVTAATSATISPACTSVTTAPAKAESKSHAGVAPGDEKKDVLSVVASFEDMGLKADLLRGIYAHGFLKPSAIQQRGMVLFFKIITHTVSHGCSCYFLLKQPFSP
jgi:hypothetical protein